MDAPPRRTLLILLLDLAGGGHAAICNFSLGFSICRIGLQPSLAELERLRNCAGDAFHYD